MIWQLFRALYRAIVPRSWQERVTTGANTKSFDTVMIVVGVLVAIAAIVIYLIAKF